MSRIKKNANTQVSPCASVSTSLMPRTFLSRASNRANTPATLPPIALALLRTPLDAIEGPPLSRLSRLQASPKPPHSKAACPPRPCCSRANGTAWHAWHNTECPAAFYQPGDPGYGHHWSQSCIGTVLACTPWRACAKHAETWPTTGSLHRDANCLASGCAPAHTCTRQQVIT